MSSSDSTRERERVRDLLKYYKPIVRPQAAEHNDSILSCADRTVESQDDGPDDSQLLAHDPTLTAFAQLGAFRLNCQRSFISLMDHEHQYILAEATRSVSLNSPDQAAAGDGLYLGSRVLDMVWGVCPNTIQVFTAIDDSNNVNTPNIVANQECYVMNDLSAIESFKDRPYVKGWPYMRFYAEVPIHSPSGHVIGTYCVVDDKPREGLDKHGLAALNEISSAIMKHLQLIQIQHRLYRSGDMIKGLGKFVESKKSTQEWWGPNSDAKPQNMYVSDGPRVGPGGHLVKLRTLSTSSKPHGIESEAQKFVSTPNEAQVQPLRLRQQSLDNSESNRTTTTSSPVLPANQEKIHQLRERKMSLAQVDTKESLASNGIKHLFSRASSLIREALGLDGIFFVEVLQQDIIDNSDDADLESHSNHVGAMTGAQPHNRTQWTEDTEMPKGEGRSSSEFAESPTESRSHPGPRSSLIAPSVIDRNRVYPPQAQLSQRALQGLLRKYPHGYVFVFDEDGHLVQDREDHGELDLEEPTPVIQPPIFSERSNEKAWWQNLQSTCPGARNLIFFPLWDPQHDRWFAGSLAWTNDAKRNLQAEDVTYLAAFGSCIMSEKSRLDALQADRAKSDFISSVSHELRSPLHGILAGTEALQSISTGPEQDDLIRTVAVCGEVLLETVDQILEYSKVKNSAKNSSVKALEGAEDFEITDLSILVENVVDGVLAGHRHRSSMLSSRYELARHTELSEISSFGDAMLILTMEWRASWMFTSRIGCWKRILINLVGNSLKYTPSGFIHISLRLAEAGSTATAEGQEMLTLQVEDSGIGMSKAYIYNKLYTPFAQENPLKAGTGLGLSIVRQLVQDLGGAINIQSEVGYGTIVVVSVPTDPAIQMPDTDERPFVNSIRAQCEGFSLCLVAFDVLPDREPPTGILTPQQRRMIALKSSLTTLIFDWFGMEVTVASSLSEAKGDFTLVLQSRIQQSDYSDSRRPLVVLEDEGRKLTTTDNGVFFLSQPVAPHKLARALSHCLEYQRSDPRISAIRDDGLVSDLKIPALSSEMTMIQPLPQAVQPDENILVNLANETSTLSPHASELQRSNTVKLLQDLQVTDLHSLKFVNRSLVLLVEDNPINLKILVNHMKRAKENYITAHNGLEAFEIYKQHHAAMKLIFMDISMPVMDGLTSTRQIRLYERERSLPRRRIAAITCFSSHKYQQDALASGIDLFLVKPVPMKSLQPILDLDPEVVMVEDHNG